MRDRTIRPQFRFRSAWHGLALILLVAPAAGYARELGAEGGATLAPGLGRARKELERLEQREKIGAVFHAAALCDYRVKSVHSSCGATVAASKIPIRV